VDDYLYQAIVRQEVAKQLINVNPWHLGKDSKTAEKLIGELITPLALKLWREQFSKTNFRLDWHKPRLAWPRLFTGVFPLQVKPT
jgi:hypothetical protein